MRHCISLLSILFCCQIATATNTDVFPFNPPRYVAYRATQPINIDGEIYGEEWENAPWIETLQDIQGDRHPVVPKYATRIKMLWDDNYLYIAAELKEPHIWATKTKRDATIYWDNDFEVFIDPDGSTHDYTEFEINAFGTEWDLRMTRGYKMGGTYNTQFNIRGLKTKVKIYGTVNDPSDTDEKWVVEMAFPFKPVSGKVPASGDQWRMNFSRVEWLKTEVINGMYRKIEGTEGFGNEENWVWSPTGLIDIHIPEYWGYVQFSDKIKGKSSKDFVWDKNEDVKFALRQLLYLQNAYKKANGVYAMSLSQLKGAENIQIKGLDFSPEINVISREEYIITVKGFKNKTITINEIGLVQIH